MFPVLPDNGVIVSWRYVGSSAACNIIIDVYNSISACVVLRGTVFLIRSCPIAPVVPAHRIRQVPCVVSIGVCVLGIGEEVVAVYGVVSGAVQVYAVFVALDGVVEHLAVIG